MHKPSRIIAQCLNCGIQFSIDKSEYLSRKQKSEQPGLFHVRRCMVEYRQNHKIANGMKERILELNQRKKQ
jgi:hypothetical protein